ncbi:MAG: type IV toxin-antitoxin system AbiEi family antitoxin [Candidatus Micrarchaeota archaeon]
MYKKSIRLGEKEVLLLSALEHDKQQAFSFDDAAKILSDASRQSVRNILSRLAKKERITRVKRGIYLLVPFKQSGSAQYSLSIAPLLAEEYYISFWSALSFHGLTNQLPSCVFAAVRKPKKERVFQNTRYKFVVLSKRYFFGFDEVELAGGKVKIASIEKTALDCLLHPEYCGGLGEIAKALQNYGKTFDWKKMRSCLSRLGNSAVERRLRYCLRFLKMKKQLAILGKKECRGFRKLDPNSQKKGNYDKELGVIINIDLGEEMR